MKKNKDDLVKFRVSENEKKILKEIAKNSGLNLSEYIRSVLFEKRGEILG